MPTSPRECSPTPPSSHVKHLANTSAEDAPIQQPPELSRVSTWSEAKKWRVVLVACYVTFMVGINSTSITAAAQAINQHFSIRDDTVPSSYWPVTAWNGGAALAPMVVIPLLERHGVRPGYFRCYVLFALFVVPQALARNFATLVASRFFAGCFAGVLQDVMDCIIADLWPEAQDRSLPVTVYVFALLEGVSFGPVYGGAIVSSLHWRWIFYIQLMICGASIPLLLAFFDETRRPETPVPANEDEDTARQIPTESVTAVLYEAVKTPTYLLFTEPVVFFFTLLSALSYGVVFVSTQSVAQVYSTLYAWPEWQTGLVQASLCAGILVGLLACCLVQNPLYHRRLLAHTRSSTVDLSDTTVPESRLYLSIPASFLGLAAGFFWYGWTSLPHLHWTLPSAGLGLLGLGSMPTMQAVMMYVTDAYGPYAGSASAAVCFGENLVAAFLPLAAPRMYARLGFPWASSCLGFVALALGCVPVVLVVRGRAIRRRSPFMSGLSAATPAV